MRRRLPLLGLAALACDPQASPPRDVAPCEAPPALAGPPALSGPCVGDVAEPTRLVVTTTDFATGAVGLVDLRTGEVTPDLALASTDAKPYVHGDRVFVLQRYMFDALDILDADDRLALLGQVGLVVDDVPSTNPHAVALGPDGRAYVSLFGAPGLQVLDIADPAAIRGEDPIDLCPVADADGTPEASLLIRCGDTLFVSIERLDRDRGFALTEDHDALAAVDLASGRLHDFDPDADGVQSLPLLGPWAKQWRLDPRAADGRAIYVLSSGLERVDLAAGASAWAVDPAALAALGLDDYRLPQAFDLDRDGRVAYLAAYTADYAEVLLLRADLEADASEDKIEIFAEGLQSVEQTLEVAGDTLWFGDRSHAAAGLRAWDISVDPPTPRFAGEPLATGLPPYALVAIP
ncbi:MAG: hypothetical protein JNL82_03520 [Myxococcales bacterium]|nr:hypothetical protein [Myxococcales bacterium]